MPKYETIPTISFKVSPCARPIELPTVVHMDDPAISVMLDFRVTKPPIISPHIPIDQALQEMKISGAHLMLVEDENQKVIGLIGSEDILGEKPITLIQERRIQRSEILVKMVMRIGIEIMSFDYDTFRQARVGNVVTSMHAAKQHYALVLRTDEKGVTRVRGLISTSQMSKQLHMNVMNSIGHAAETLAELQKRHT